MSAGAGVQMWVRGKNVNQDLAGYGTVRCVGVFVHLPPLPFVRKIKFMIFGMNAGW
jgi:hypothetical protein